MVSMRTVVQQNRLELYFSLAARAGICTLTGPKCCTKYFGEHDLFGHTHSEIRSRNLKSQHILTCGIGELAGWGHRGQCSAGDSDFRQFHSGYHCDCVDVQLLLLLRNKVNDEGSSDVIDLGEQGNDYIAKRSRSR